MRSYIEVFSEALRLWPLALYAVRLLPFTGRLANRAATSKGWPVEQQLEMIGQWSSNS